MITFGEMMRARRKALGMTQEELAEVLGVKQATVSDLERGKKEPRWPNAVKIARTLSISLDILAGIANNNH